MTSQPALQAAGSTQVAHLSFTGPINNDTVGRLSGAFMDLASSGIVELHFLFSTGGGLVIPGLHLHNLVRAMPYKLVVYNMSQVESIGVPIFLAARERYACPNATFKLGTVHWGVAAGEYYDTDLARIQDDVQAANDHTASVLVEQLGTDLATARGYCTRENRDSDFAKASGLINDVRLPPPLPTGGVWRFVS